MTAKATPSKTAGNAISRMPASVQESVSRCLADGGTWRDVSSITEAAGRGAVNAQNVTNYRKGAHAEWLKRQERLEEHRAAYAWRNDLLKKYTEEGGSAEAGLAAAMDMMEAALADCGGSDIKSLIADKPGMIFKVVDSLAKLRRELADIRAEKREATAAEASSTIGTNKRGLTEAERSEIEEAMSLF
ncbi:MAG: hypothetical protein RR250_02870 [Akkermansia sp.]